MSIAETHLWSGTAAENNPCPSGFRLPTNDEWEQEKQTWSSNNAAGAIASPLKLPMTGYRDGSNGSINLVGTYGHYWSSTVYSINSSYFYFHIGNAQVATGSQSSGMSVRCIKD